MLDRDVGLTGPIPEGATDLPAAREARVEREGAIDQRHHRTDVLAEIRQRSGGIGKDARIIAGDLQGPPRKIDALPRVPGGIRAPAVGDESKAAETSPGEGGPVMRIALDCLIEKAQRLGNL